MRLRNTRSVLWTEYPTDEEAAALAAYEAAPEDERPALAAAMAPAQQTRITVGAMSALQYARFDVARADARAWIEEETGEKEATARHTPLIRFGLTWARMRGALVRMETRTASRTDDSAGPWTEIDPPAAWETPAGYLGDLPIDLVEAIDDIVIGLNPTVFFGAIGAIQNDADAKKNGGASAGR